MKYERFMFEHANDTVPLLAGIVPKLCHQYSEVSRYLFREFLNTKRFFLCFFFSFISSLTETASGSDENSLHLMSS